jgi:hypothetical protein
MEDLGLNKLNSLLKQVELEVQQVKITPSMAMLLVEPFMETAWEIYQETRDEAWLEFLNRVETSYYTWEAYEKHLQETPDPSAITLQ